MSRCNILQDVITLQWACGAISSCVTISSTVSCLSSTTQLLHSNSLVLPPPCLADPLSKSSILWPGMTPPQSPRNKPCPTVSLWCGFLLCDIILHRILCLSSTTCCIATHLFYLVHHAWLIPVSKSSILFISEWRGRGMSTKWDNPSTNQFCLFASLLAGLDTCLLYKLYGPFQAHSHCIILDPVHTRVWWRSEDYLIKIRSKLMLTVYTPFFP